MPRYRRLKRACVRDRAESVTVGTPLTHARFNRRYRGTYGPAGAKTPGDLKGFGTGATPVKNLWIVGDSQFPGIGLPAAAASGILARSRRPQTSGPQSTVLLKPSLQVANALVPLDTHAALLDEMRAAGSLLAGNDWWQAPCAAPLHPGGGRIAADARLDELGTRRPRTPE